MKEPLLSAFIAGLCIIILIDIVIIVGNAVMWLKGGTLEKEHPKIKGTSIPKIWTIAWGVVHASNIIPFLLVSLIGKSIFWVELSIILLSIPYHLVVIIPYMIISNYILFSKKSRKK